MKALLKFIVVANVFAIAIAALGYFFIPFIQQQKIVDILFIIGLIFWALSSFIRLGDRRLKSTNSPEISTDNQQHIFKPDHLATRLLFAGTLPLVGAILLGSIIY